MAKTFSIKKAVIWENDDFVVLNKPPHLSCLDDRNDAQNLLQLLRRIYPAASLCHRLDKNTSGVIVAAKHDEAYRHLSLQFQHKEVRKVYHAIVQGTLQLDRHVIDMPIVKKNNGTAFCAHHGKPAQTIFSTLVLFNHFTLLECQPITGRYHQIRVHLAAAETPIVADTLYGAELPFLSQIKKRYTPSKREENPMMPRQALHASSIAFKGMQEDLINIEAPYANDLAVFLKLLERHDAIQPYRS